MKKIIPTLLILILFISCFAARKTYMVDLNPVSKVIEVKENKNELYLESNQWMIQSFKDSEKVIQFKDKESGVISGKYAFSPYPNYNTHYNMVETKYFYALIKIQIKDGATKITIDPIPHKYETLESFDINILKSNLLRDVNSMINSYEKFIENNSSENW